ncbi:aldehyde dehydrogenase [Streptomyces canarius]
MHGVGRDACWPRSPAPVFPWSRCWCAEQAAPAPDFPTVAFPNPEEPGAMDLALFFADICRQAGLPKGVVNILPGYGDTGAALVAHPDVNKVAFTGSTAVGKEIARTVAGTRKKLTLELGGKGANIVFDDAPIDQAVEGIVNGIFFNQGQVCCAGSRLLVQESIQDELLDSLKRRLSTLRLGDPLDKNTDIGAINSAEQLHHIATALAEQGEAEGAERWAPACELPSAGYWFAPTLFTNVTQAHTITTTRSSARCCRSSPSVRPTRPTTPSTACRPASGPRRARGYLAVANKLRAGVVWSNTFNKFDPTSPFGGYKESGFGREGGRHGLEAYLDV